MKILNDPARVSEPRKPARRRRSARSLPRRIVRKARELERKWDREERVKAAAVPAAVGGALLGILVSRWFFVLPIAIAGYYAQKPVRRWLPRIVFVGRVIDRVAAFRRRVRSAFRFAAG